MYKHIDRVEDFLIAERGIQITRVKNDKSFEDLMFEAIRAEQRDGVTGFGWPGAMVRWCTGQLKAHLLDGFVRSLTVPSYRYVGFAADEGYRLERKNNQGKAYRYPLYDWGITESEALAGCYRAGYTWAGLYERFTRVSCWCCPLQSLKELRNLWQFYPDLWSRLRALDDRAIEQFGKFHPYGQFRKKESVRMLEFRFELERMWLQNQQSTKSKQFYKELSRLYTENFFVGHEYFTGPTSAEIKTVQESVAEELLSYITDDDLKPLLVVDTDSLNVHKKNRPERARHKSPAR